MDEQTLTMLVDEALEAAEWYGNNPTNRIAETIGMGIVAGRRRLDREELEQLRRALNLRLQQIDQREIGWNLIQSAIRNTN